jgi:hypothetical protein
MKPPKYFRRLHLLRSIFHPHVTERVISKTPMTIGEIKNKAAKIAIKIEPLAPLNAEKITLVNMEATGMTWTRQ